MVVQSDWWMSPRTPAGLLTAYGTTYHVLDVLKVPVTSVFVKKVVTFTRARATSFVVSYEILRRFNLSKKNAGQHAMGDPLTPYPQRRSIKDTTTCITRHASSFGDDAHGGKSGHRPACRQRQIDTLKCQLHCA